MAPPTANLINPDPQILQESFIEFHPVFIGQGFEAVSFNQRGASYGSVNGKRIPALQGLSLPSQLFKPDLRFTHS
eukprot:989686-Pelagomonas_calceolata.AAC.6